MKFPWRVERKPETSAEIKLEQVKKALFPPLIVREEMTADGQVMRYHVDYSVDSNLDAALMDLQEGNNDSLTQDTINKVVARLNEVRRLLEAYAQLDKDAKYIIVENLEDNSANVQAGNDRNQRNYFFN